MSEKVTAKGIFHLTICCLLITVVLIILLPGCGKKGPPLPSYHIRPVPVTDLRGMHRETSIWLFWSGPARWLSEDGSSIRIKGFYILRAEAHEASELNDCRCEFKRLTFITAERGGDFVYADNTIVYGYSYLYNVIIVGPQGVFSKESNSILITPEQPPDAPSDIGAISRDKEVLLTWQTPGKGVLGYNIYRTTGSKGKGRESTSTPINKGLVLTTRYIDKEVENNIPYTYTIRAVNNNLDEGPPSEEATVMPQRQTPPQSPQGLAAIYNGKEVVLTWRDNPEPWVKAYNIYRASGIDKGFVLIGQSRASAYIDKDIEKGLRYFYRVTAIDDSPRVLESVASNTAEAIAD